MLKILSRVALVIQAGLSVLLVKLIMDYNFLPLMYTAMLIGGLTILWLFTLFLQRRPKKDAQTRYVRSKRNNKLKRKMLLREKMSLIMVMLSCIVLVLGNYYVYLGNLTLNQLTNTNTTIVHTINVRVMADSNYQTLEDLQNEEVEFCTNNNAEYVAEYVNILEGDNGLDTSIADDFQTLVENLYNGDSAAIVMDTMDEIYLSGLHEDYQDETRVIATYEIEVENTSTTTSTTPSSTKVPDVMNIFVSGIDTYGSITTVARSDVNMILTINFDTHEILMTGIPRDYYVTLHSKQAEDKLTHAGNYGIEESVSTVEDLMGMEIDYYIRLNFSSLIDIVNALGGIDLYNPTAFTAVGTYEMPVGNIHLDGKQALFYSRERHTLPNGDNDRIANQQRIISAIIDKAISPTIITSYSSLLQASLSAIQTNIPTGLITNIIKAQLANNDSWNLQHQYLEGTEDRSTECYSMPGYNLYVTIPDQDSIDQANENIEKVSNGISVNFDNISSYVEDNVANSLSD